LTLTAELDAVRVELNAREQAIANLKTELESRGEVKQLTLFPGQDTTPEQTPEPNPVKLVIDSDSEIVKPASTPEPKTKPKAKPKAKAKAKTKTKFPEGSLSTMELVARINQNFPGDNIEYSDLNDCLTLKNGKPKSDKLSDYKAKYGFEFLGKFAGQRRFKLV